MKISAAILPFIFAQSEAGKGKFDVCQACDGKNYSYFHSENIE